MVVGVMTIITPTKKYDEPKCIKPGCNSNQERGSSYCYLHKPYVENESMTNSSSYSSKSTENYSHTETTSTSSSSYSNDKPKQTTNSSYNKNSYTTKKKYDSYDDGYDDIFMNGDYDYDRYDKDRGYADGVDDAIDEYEEEFGEDW